MEQNERENQVIGERDLIAARVARFKAIQARLTHQREADAKAIWEMRLVRKNLIRKSGA